MKKIGLLIVSILIAVGLTSCSSQPTTYVPTAAAFGANGQCYMPLGVPQTAWQAIEQQYIAHHYCQAGWSPVMMPNSVYMSYYPYYSSPLFMRTYIPSAYIGGYRSYETNFGRTYHSQILTAERTATYRGSNGKTTTYSPSKMGGGSRSSFGGGTRCSGMRNALLKPQYQTRGGGGGGGGGGRGGGGFGGGSRSGSGTSGGSKSGSGSGSGTTSRNGGFKSGSYGGC